MKHMSAVRTAPTMLSGTNRILKHDAIRTVLFYAHPCRMRPGSAIFISKYHWPGGLQKGRRNRGTGPTKRAAVKKGHSMQEWFKGILGETYNEHIGKKVSAEMD